MANWREIGAVGELLQQRRGLAASFDIGGGVVILAVVKLRVLARSDQNLRDAILRFRRR